MKTIHITVEARFIAKEARPITKILPINFPFGFNPDNLSLNALFFEHAKNQNTKTAPPPWPNIVARPLPATPQPNSKTKIQLRTIQIITLTTLVNSANLGAPAVLMKLFIPMPTASKKNP